jgi:DNA-binding CsgD family transcriptional regulator
MINKKPLLVLLLLLVCQFSAIAQNLNELLSKKQGVERMQWLGGKIMEWAKQPEKLNALKKLVNENCNEEEKLFVERAADPIINIDNPTFEQQLTNADYYIQKFNKTNYPFLKAVAYYTKAVRYRDNKRYNEALENFIYCYEFLGNDPDSNYYEQSWYLHGIASTYYQFNDFAKAIDIAKKAEKQGARYTPNADWFELINPNLVGMAFLKNGDYDTAKVWLQKAYNRALTQRNSYWVGIAGGNIGNTFYMTQKYAEAIPYFTTAIDTCKKLNLWDNTSAFSVNLADCYLRISEIGPIPSLLEQAKIANKVDSRNDSWYRYYKTAASYYKITGNTSLAFKFEDSANFYDKKLTAEYDITKKARTETEWANSKATLENELQIQKTKREKWILYSILAATMLLITIGILYYKRQKLRFLLRQEHLELEKLKTEDSLKLAQSQLHDFTENIKQKNDMLLKFSAEIENLQKQNHSITNEQIASIEALKKTAILTPDDWNNFKILFNKGYPGYLNKLENQYPNLTAAETRYILLFKLNLSTREMATLLGVSIENVRNLRFRVKKKMNLAESEEIDDRLKTI